MADSTPTTEATTIRSGQWAAQLDAFAHVADLTLAQAVHAYMLISAAMHTKLKLELIAKIGGPISSYTIEKGGTVTALEIVTHRGRDRDLGGQYVGKGNPIACKLRHPVSFASTWLYCHRCEIKYIYPGYEGADAALADTGSVQEAPNED